MGFGEIARGTASTDAPESMIELKSIASAYTNAAEGRPSDDVNCNEASFCSLTRLNVTVDLAAGIDLLAQIAIKVNRWLEDDCPHAFDTATSLLDLRPEANGSAVILLAPLKELIYAFSFERFSCGQQ